MKLSKTQAKDLTDVLNAQAGVKKIEDKEVYAKKLASVGEFMNTKDGKASGGITKETYNDNKDNADLVAAAKAHLDKAKARGEKGKDAPAKKAPAAKKAAKAAPAKDAAPKERSAKEEKATADKYVAYVKAITGEAKLPKKEFADVEISTRKHRDPVKGGLKAEAFKRFGGFPGVKEAAKAAQAHAKNKGQEMGG